MENKFKQEKAVVSVERHNCLKHPPAVPLRWCQKRVVGAVLVKIVQFCRLFGGLDGVFSGVVRKNVLYSIFPSEKKPHRSDATLIRLYV